MLYSSSGIQQPGYSSSMSIIFIIEYIAIFAFIAACIIVTTMLIIKHEKDRHGK